MQTGIASLRHEKFIRFIRAYGPEAFIGTDEELDKYLDWFLAHKRLLVVRADGGPIAIACGLVIKDPTDIALAERWPEEDINGEFLYCPAIVVKPEYRHKNIMKYCIWKATQFFPNVKYVYYMRHEKSKILSIRRVIHGED